MSVTTKGGLIYQYSRRVCSVLQGEGGGRETEQCGRKKGFYQKLIHYLEKFGFIRGRDFVTGPPFPGFQPNQSTSKMGYLRAAADHPHEAHHNI